MTLTEIPRLDMQELTFICLKWDHVLSSSKTSSHTQVLCQHRAPRAAHGSGSQPGPLMWLCTRSNKLRSSAEPIRPTKDLFNLAVLLPGLKTVHLKEHPQPWMFGARVH